MPQERNGQNLALLALIAGALFLIWSNSFVAASYLCIFFGSLPLLALTSWSDGPQLVVLEIALALLWPATFTLRLSPLEWVGGGLALAGLAIAVLSEGR